MIHPKNRMNERIEMLAGMADLLGDFEPSKIPGYYVGTIKVADIEYFANLIIDECIHIINADTTPDSGTVYAPEIIGAIDEYFGRKK